jgi:adenylylsulfate kinase
VIVAVCGPPAAGKTTLANHLRDRLAAEGVAVSTLHSDDFSRRTYKRMYDRVAADPDAHWVLDGTFYREAWQERFRELGARFVLVTASLDACLERNRRREDGVDERGLRVVSAEFHPPDADLEIDTDSLAVGPAVDRLYDAVTRWCETEASR